MAVAADDVIQEGGRALQLQSPVHLVKSLLLLGYLTLGVHLAETKDLTAYREGKHQSYSVIYAVTELGRPALEKWLHSRNGRLISTQTIAAGNTYRTLRVLTHPAAESL